jgi:uncharacterized protein YhjY with autotransporter beta-barrel domain
MGHHSCDCTDSFAWLSEPRVARTFSTEWLLRLAATLFLLAIFSWFNSAYAGTPSTQCAPQTRTVASGASVTIDMSNCSRFGLDGVAVAPSHGRLDDIDTFNGNFTSIFTYVNNGDGSLTDTFTVNDDTGAIGNPTNTNGGIAFTITVGPAAPPAPVAGAVSQTVAYSSNANPITLNLSGGTATSVTVATAASHGTATASGTTITYTPTVGYAGTDSFTYRATNTTGTSTAATVTITVLPQVPVAGAVSRTVAYGSSANAIALNLTGGTAASVTVATPASHGTATASGTTITYTPTVGYAGADTFTYTATNTGGTSSPATVTITVSPQQPVAGAVTQTVANGSTANAITLNLSGGTPTSVAVATAASHGSATASGTAITYTPTQGYTGTDTFTYTATNITGTSPSATVTITVSPPLPPIAGAVARTVAYGSTANTITLVLTGGTVTSVAVATPASHGTATATGTSITYQPLAGYSGPDSFTYTASNAGGGSAPATVTITVSAPSTMTLTPASGAALPSGARNVAYSAAVTAAGGSGTYGYSLIAGTLPTGITLNPTTGALSGTTLQTGGFSFTVRATDTSTGTNAPFVADGSYTLAIAAPTIGLPATVANGTAGVPYSVSAAASGGTAPYIYRLVSGLLPDGVTLNTSDGSLSGTPTRSGPFSFTIEGKDSNNFTGQKTYGMSIAAASITLSPATLPGTPTAETAYTTTLSGSGGTAPYSFAVTAGTLPIGWTLNPTTGVLSGTTHAAGPFNATITVTDSSLGVGAPFSNFRVYSGTVAAPGIALAPAALSVANANVAYSQQFTVTGGLAPYTYALASGAWPAGISLNASTGLLSGTPTAVGNFPVTVRVTDAHNFSAQQVLTLAVGQAPPTQVADIVATPANQPITINVTSNDSGPITSIAISTPPAHGTATVDALTVLYTPIAGYFGSDVFRYIATGPGGTSAPATVTVNVAPPAAVAGAHSATVNAGNTVTVDLMAGATGGPITAAAIVAISPASAGTALINNVGTTGLPSFQMTFAAAASFAGSAVVSYTLSNAHSTSAPANVNITVNARRDMSTDSEVIGLVAAQTDAALRFASAQVSNFTRRLESLHGSGWGRSSVGISVAPQPGPEPMSPYDATAQRRRNDEAATRQRNDDFRSDFDRPAGSGAQLNMRKVGWQQRPDTARRAPGAVALNSDAASDTNAVRGNLPDLPTPQEDSRQQPLSLWVGGAIDFGQRSANGNQTGFRFRTSGMSTGVDYRINDLATIGIGGGFSRDNTDVSDNGTKNKAESVVAAVYGSLRPLQDVFIDGVLGYGRLNFDSTRYITDGGGFATGVRHGDQVFGAIVSGIEFRGKDWMWSPYGRLEMTSATLDQYTEKAAGTNALTYFQQTARSTSGALGVRMEGQYAGRIGTWMPRGRLEFRHQFHGADNASLAYADLAYAGPAYTVRTTNMDSGNWNAGIGMRLLLRRGLMFAIDYSSNLDVGNGRSQSIMFGIEVPL